MKKTVFIVGAGSSIAMGGEHFPTGATLLEKIGNVLEAPQSGQSRPADAQFILDVVSRKLGPDGVRRFIETAKRVVPLTRTHNSIDQLITSTGSPEVAFLAKVCIAYFIGKTEASLVSLADHRATVRTRSTWLISYLREYLSRTRNAEEASDRLQEIAFVVFNYDRLVEHLLKVFLEHRYELTDGQAMAMVEKLEIVHPYGKLASLKLSPDIDGYPLGYQHFEGEFFGRLEQFVASLRTFGESVDQAIPDGVKGMVDTATNLIFVGFGFGPENLDLVLPDDNTGPLKRMFATTTLIHPRRWQNLEQSVLTRLSRASDDRRRALLNQVYSAGRIDVVQTCGDLIDQFSLEWGERL